MESSPPAKASMDGGAFIVVGLEIKRLVVTLQKPKHRLLPLSKSVCAGAAACEPPHCAEVSVIGSVGVHQASSCPLEEVSCRKSPGASYIAPPSWTTSVQALQRPCSALEVVFQLSIGSHDFGEDKKGKVIKSVARAQVNVGSQGHIGNARSVVAELQRGGVLFDTVIGEVSCDICPARGEPMNGGSPSLFSVLSSASPQLGDCLLPSLFTSAIEHHPELMKVTVCLANKIATAPMCEALPVGEQVAHVELLATRCLRGEHLSKADRKLVCRTLKQLGQSYPSVDVAAAITSLSSRGGDSTDNGDALCVTSAVVAIEELEKIKDAFSPLSALSSSITADANLFAFPPLLVAAANVLSIFAEAAPFGSSLVKAIAKIVCMLQAHKEMITLSVHIHRRLAIFLSVLSTEAVVRTIVRHDATKLLLLDCVSGMHECIELLSAYAGRGTIMKGLTASATIEEVQHKFDDLLSCVSQLHDMTNLLHVSAQADVAIALHSTMPSTETLVSVATEVLVAAATPAEEPNFSWVDAMQHAGFDPSTIQQILQNQGVEAATIGELVKNERTKVKTVGKLLDGQYTQAQTMTHVLRAQKKMARAIHKMNLEPKVHKSEASQNARQNRKIVESRCESESDERTDGGDGVAAQRPPCDALAWCGPHTMEQAAVRTKLREHFRIGKPLHYIDPLAREAGREFNVGLRQLSELFGQRGKRNVVTVLVEGGVGSGKSSLLSYVAATQGDELPPAVLVSLPFLARSVASRGAAKPSRAGLIEWVLGRDVAAAMAVYTGRVLWLVDGLDEVAGRLLLDETLGFVVSCFCGLRLGNAVSCIHFDDLCVVSSRQERPVHIMLPTGQRSHLFPDDVTAKIVLLQWTPRVCYSFLEHAQVEHELKDIDRDTSDRVVKSLMDLVSQPALGALACTPIVCRWVMNLAINDPASFLDTAAATNWTVLDVIEQTVLHCYERACQLIPQCPPIQRISARLGKSIHEYRAFGTEIPADETAILEAMQIEVGGARALRGGTAKSHDMIEGFFVARHLQQRLVLRGAKQGSRAVADVVGSFVSFELNEIAKSSTVLLLAALMIHRADQCSLLKLFLVVVVEQFAELYKRSGGALPADETLSTPNVDVSALANKFGISLLVDLAAVLPPSIAADMIRHLRQQFFVLFNCPRAFHMMLLDSVRVLSSTVFEATIEHVENAPRLRRRKPIHESLASSLFRAVAYDAPEVNTTSVVALLTKISPRCTWAQGSLVTLIRSGKPDLFRDALQHKDALWFASEDCSQCFRQCGGHRDPEFWDAAVSSLISRMKPGDAMALIGATRSIVFSPEMERLIKKYFIDNIQVLLPAACRIDTAMKWIIASGVDLPPLPSLDVEDMPEFGERELFHECFATFCGLAATLHVSLLRLSFGAPMSMGSILFDGAPAFQALGRALAKSRNPSLSVELCIDKDTDAVKNTMREELPRASIIVMERDDALTMQPKVCRGPHEEVTLKLLVVGECGTGKTQLIKRYAYGTFRASSKASIGVDFALKRWGSTVLQIWDIAGQERFGDMSRVYYHAAAGAMIVCNVNRPETIESAIKWKHDLDSKVFIGGKTIPCILVLNKCDLISSLELDAASMNSHCRQHGFDSWVVTSARNDINVTSAFGRLADLASSALGNAEEAKPDARAPHNFTFRRKPKATLPQSKGS